MNLELFSSTGGIRVESEMRVNLYADEIKPFRNLRGEIWMYLGIVAVPEQMFAHALNLLQDDRKATGYEGELHFSDLTRHQKASTAKLWLDRVMLDEQKCFHFYVLGLSLDRLQRTAFGRSEGEQLRSIYNRFFRTAVAYTLRGFWGDYERITVSAVFHDRTDMENDRVFDWHTIWRLEQVYDQVRFAESRVEFIDSDHRRESRNPLQSHFIQLADVILGATRQCLDCTSRKRHLTEVAEHFAPLVERLTGEETRDNKNSRYRHFRRCSVGFFPKYKLTTQDLSDLSERARSGFFHRRPMLIREVVGGQEHLFY